MQLEFLQAEKIGLRIIVNRKTMSVCNEIYVKAEKNTIETIIEIIILYGRQCLSRRLMGYL
jgi:hypothetical protein